MLSCISFNLVLNFLNDELSIAFDEVVILPIDVRNGDDIPQSKFPPLLLASSQGQWPGRLWGAVAA